MPTIDDLERIKYKTKLSFYLSPKKIFMLFLSFISSLKKKLFPTSVISPFSKSFSMYDVVTRISKLQSFMVSQNVSSLMIAFFLKGLSSRRSTSFLALLKGILSRIDLDVNLCFLTHISTTPFIK